MTPKLLFVYGTLMRGYGNNRLLGDSKFIGEAETVTPWCFHQAGIPFLLPKETGPEETRAKVKGEVYEVVSEAVLCAVDGLEGHPTWYVRSPIIVEINGVKQKVEAYVMPELAYGEPQNPVGGYHAFSRIPNR